MATKDSPDAALWCDQDGAHYLCALCATTDVRKARGGTGGAYRAAIAHLWRTHSLRRVWIIEEVPHLETVTQLAFDAAVQHNTQFRRGGTEQ